MRSKRLGTIILAMSLALGSAGCWGGNDAPEMPETVPGVSGVACPPGYAKDGTGDDAEQCERDSDGNGIGDDDEKAEADKKKTKKPSSTKSVEKKKKSTNKKK